MAKEECRFKVTRRVHSYILRGVYNFPIHRFHHSPRLFMAIMPLLHLHGSSNTNRPSSPSGIASGLCPTGSVDKRSAAKNSSFMDITACSEVIGVSLDRSMGKDFHRYLLIKDAGGGQLSDFRGH